MIDRSKGSCATGAGPFFYGNITLEPMNAYERHVIHTALQDTQYITTFSIGTEPNRRVVVSYDRTKQ